jgi:predicted amidophosphoribosyltransferase
MLLIAYDECTTATSTEMDKRSHENAILHASALSPLEQDRQLYVTYHHRSEAERGWNYTRILLDITCEEVDICTHGVIHLEHQVESQDVEPKERVEMITKLEQQLLEL